MKLTLSQEIPVPVSEVELKPVAEVEPVGATAKVDIRLIDFGAGTISYDLVDAGGRKVDSGNSVAHFVPSDSMPTEQDVLSAIEASALR